MTSTTGRTSSTSAAKPTDNSRPKFEIPKQRYLSACLGPALQAPSACYDLKDLASISIHEGECNVKIFTLPRDLLMWHSSYFAAALDPDSGLGAKDGNLVLQEDHAVFDAFVRWLWTGRLKDLPHSHTRAVPEDTYLKARLLRKIWVFGDIRGVPGLCNAAIDMMHERMAATWHHGLRQILWIYENTTSGAALRKFIVDSFTLTQSPSFWAELNADEIPTQFVLDALPILTARGVAAEPIERHTWTKLDRCQWHDHSGPGGKLRLESRK